MKYLVNKTEVFSYYITSEFDGNHILHMHSSKRGDLDVWWGVTEPTIQDIVKMYDKYRKS